MRQQAKNVGLKGYSRLRKAQLVEFIPKAQDAEMVQRIQRATQIGRYPVSSAWCRGQPGAISRRATRNSRRSRRFPASQEGCERAPKSSVSSIHSREISYGRKMFLEPLATRIVKEGAAIHEKQDGEQETTIKGRRMLTFTFRRKVGGALTDRMMEKLADRVQTSFYLRYLYTYKIRNIETGEMRNFRIYAPGSPRMVGMTKARAWITKQEEIRLSQDNLDRPST